MIAGQPQSDDDLISQILAGLGAEYDYVVVNITSRQDTITFILAQHNALSTIDVSNASANYANNYGNNNGMRGNNSRGRSRGRGRDRVRYRNKIIFQLCGKGGYMVSSCHRRFDQTFQGVVQQQQTNQ
ncbi:hypothetical protein ACOSQ2_028835 [Xanthoceras sorbifolium]